MIPSSICRKCGTERIKRNYPSGSEWYCAPCYKEGHRNWQRQNSAKKRDGLPLRGPRKAPLRYDEAKRIWDRGNPEKRRAHKIVEGAILSGRIRKEPCAICGELRSQAHHDDYSKPLDVMWLCPKHHSARHRELAAVSASSAPLGESSLSPDSARRDSSCRASLEAF